MPLESQKHVIEAVTYLLKKKRCSITEKRALEIGYGSSERDSKTGDNKLT